MASLYNRINDNIGPLIFDTYTQTEKDITTLYFSAGEPVSGTLLSKSLTEITMKLDDDTVITYPLQLTYDYSQPVGYSYVQQDGTVITKMGGFEEDDLPDTDPLNNANDWYVTYTYIYAEKPYVVSYNTITDTTVDADKTPTQSIYKEILTRYCHQAIRDITDKTLAVNPKDMHLFCQNLFIMNMGTFGDITNTLNFGEYAVPWKDSDGGFFIDNNYVLWVARKFEGIKAPAHEISAEKGLRVTDPDSIYYSGVDYRNPVFYRSSSKIYVYPAITETEIAYASMVKYDEKFAVDSESIDYFPEHLLFLVVLYASIRALKLAAGDQRKVYKDRYSSPLKVWNDLYPDASIGATHGLSKAIVLPTVPKGYTADASGDSESVDHDIQKDYPDITQKTYNWADEGEVMSIEETLKESWEFIATEEEPALSAAAINRFQMLVTDYQAVLSEQNQRYQNVLSRYATEMKDWQTKFNTVIAVWQQNQNSYEKEMMLLNQEIQRFEQEYNSHFFPKHYQEKRKEEGSY
tara:strand:+ start:69 stop:1628 length:1560 start_codon:yes stop_codon:yes gene_type:complete